MRILAGVLVLLVGLPTLAYAGLVIINWNDEAPSADAERLASVYRDRPAVAAADNGRIHLDALKADPEGLDSEQALLERYRAMLASTGWREEVPEDPRAPLPYYQGAMEAQKLHLLDARRLALTGDAEAVRDLLERDLVFWRGVMAASDMLVTKMVAVTMAGNNFELGNLALRALPPNLVEEAVPPSWREPLTVEERSLLRVMGGEWRFMVGAMRGASSGRETRQGSLGDRLAHPLLQEQATLNIAAGRMVRVGELSELPYAELRPALERLGEEPAPPAFRLYNPVGTVLRSISPPGLYSGYIARVSDLEGARRAALLAARLRGAGTGADDLGAAVQAAELRNPYDGSALEWDAGSGAVVFEGLAGNERGRHAFPL